MISAAIRDFVEAPRSLVRKRLPVQKARNLKLVGRLRLMTTLKLQFCHSLLPVPNAMAKESTLNIFARIFPQTSSTNYLATFVRMPQNAVFLGA
jgi:hypothetical protein